MNDTRKLQVSLSGPDIGEAEIAMVNRVLRSPSLSMGPYMEEFETRVAEYLGIEHAIAVSSGTAGLHLSVIAAGVTEGDEVITTPFSFVASANCVLYERATPVFVDIDPVTMNIDVEQIEAAITPRTKAIVPVHIFGLPCDMQRIMDLARRHNVTVIEDSCEAIGAEWQGQKAGTYGQCGVFAFYPNKQITTGEGGMIVTRREDWNGLFRSLRNQGRDGSGAWLRHIRLGYNYRMDEMSAALGAVQMSHIEDLLRRRDQVARMYNERLASVSGVTIPCCLSEAHRSWFVYVIRLDPAYDRDSVMIEMETRGVPTRPYFAPLHLQPFYAEKFGYRQGAFRNTEMISRTTLALPFHNRLASDQIDFVADALVASLANQH